MASNTEIEIISQKRNADRIVTVLKELVKSAICQGFGKNSYLVRDHIKYIKKIESSNDPEMHVIYTAKKLFPNEEAYLEKIEKIHAKYTDDILSNFENLYALYYQLSKEKSQRRKISKTEAENILADLLFNGPLMEANGW
jgi:hypothetical protein